MSLQEKHKFHSPNETADFARRFAEKLHAGDVVAFYGELGAGKTFIIKHICRALKSIEEPTSPSFTLINQYHTLQGVQIYHFDFYRLTHEAELANLGIDDFLYDDNICLVEWADRIRSFLPSRRYDIIIRFMANEPEGREIEIHHHGEHEESI